MGVPPPECLIPEVSQKPTAVVLEGTSRPLLNWVLYAILVRGSANYVWADVRPKGVEVDPDDPLAHAVIPPAQLTVVEPDELLAAIGSIVSAGSSMSSQNAPGESPPTIEFGRLPDRAQVLVERATLMGRVTLFGLSNVDRLAPVLNPEVARMTVEAIREAGASFVHTWASSIPAPSDAADFVIDVQGTHPQDWRNAVLHCRVGASIGPMRQGKSARVEDLPQVADVLSPLIIRRT